MSDSKELIVKQLIPLIEEHNCRTVCDYGCGDSELLQMLLANNSSLQLTGIDYFEHANENEINNAKAKGIHLIERASVEYKELCAEPVFDMIVSTFALHHFQYPVQELQSIAHLVKPGGLLAFFEHKHDPTTRAGINKAIISFISELQMSLSKGYHRHHYSLEEAKDLFLALPVTIRVAESFKNEKTEEEKKEDKDFWLTRNKNEQGDITQYASEYWKNIWLPMLAVAEKQMEEFGIDFSELFMIVAERNL